MLVVRKLRLAQPTGLVDGFVSTPCPVIKLTHLSLKRDLEEVKMLPAHTSTSDFTVSGVEIGVEIESRKQKCKAALPSPSSTRSRRAGPSGPTQRCDRGPRAPQHSHGLWVSERRVRHRRGKQGMGEAA